MPKLRIHSVDQRFSKDIKALRRASISLDRGARSLDCSILEFSDGGARLRPSAHVPLPHSFQLRLTPSLTIGCEVAYRDKDDIGVTFVPR